MWSKRRLLYAAGTAAAVLLAGGAVAAAVTSGSGKDHAPVATGAPTPAPTPSVPESSPTPAPTTPPPPPPPGSDIKGPLDLVILGVDTRVTIPDWQPHSDAVMLLHVDAGLRSGYLYSLPRDLRVAMPRFPKAGFAGGTFKLTEAMSRGAKVPGTKRANVPQGFELLTKTLSAYTGIKHFQGGAILNFGGLERLTNALGGIDVTVDQTVRSHHRRPDGTLRPLRPGGGDFLGPQKVYNPGRQHFVGWQAIDYSRQRYGLPSGDYDRQRHQRQVVRALLQKALSQGLAGNPARLQGIVKALGAMLVYVGGRTPLEYAYALRGLTPANLTLVGLPGGGVGSGGRYLGEALKPEGRAFLYAVAHNAVPAFLKAHPGLVNRG